MSKYGNDIGIALLFIPMMCKWLLPPGIELLFYVCLFDIIPLFIPNLLIPLSVFFLERKPAGAHLSFLLIFDFCICIISLLVNGTEYWVSTIFGECFYIYAFLLAVNYTFYEKKRIFLWAFIPLIILTIQVVVYGFGFATLKDPNANNQFANVLRVYTTVGAATGSGCIVVMLGIISYYTTPYKKIGMASLLIALVASALLMSRMPFVCISCFLLYVMIKDFKKDRKKTVVFALMLVLTYLIGVFDPIYQRVINKDDFTSQRDVLIERVLTDFKGNELLGLGIGNVFATDEFSKNGIRPIYVGAPHNSYILLLCEQGYLGTFIFMLFLALLLYECWLQDKQNVFTIFLLLLTIYNSETVVLTNPEFVFLFAILIMLCRSNRVIATKGK